MKPKEIHKPTFNVVGLQCKLSTEEAPQLWEAFLPRMNEIKYRLNSNVFYGVCDDIQQIYTAGVEVSNLSEIPHGMVHVTIPDNNYAVFTHHGYLGQLENTYIDILEWLERNNYKTLNKPPYFELYDHRYVRGSTESEFDIYMVLTPEIQKQIVLDKQEENTELPIL